MIDIANSPLAIALSAAVPLHIGVLEGKGGPSQQDYEAARSFASELGEHGDILLYRGKKQGETAALFNKLARATAVLSFCPGGVKIFGTLYEGHLP